jgi:5'-nucleotidase
MKQLLRPAFAALALLNPAFAFAESANPVDLRILAINDFHGYLRPSSGIRIIDLADKTKKSSSRPADRRRWRAW